MGGLLLAALLGCFPPDGPEPRRSSGRTPPPVPADDPLSLSPKSFAVLEFPTALPQPAWTRTAPLTLVDERGSPAGVVQGHHTRVQLQHLYADRALIQCSGCEQALRGWVQANTIMPEGHRGNAVERADPRLDLALYAAELRHAVRDGRQHAHLQQPPAKKELALSVLDQGFLEHEGSALAPPAAAAEGYAGPSIALRRLEEGWALKRLWLGDDP